MKVTRKMTVWGDVFTDEADIADEAKSSISDSIPTSLNEAMELGDGDRDEFARYRVTITVEPIDH